MPLLLCLSATKLQYCIYSIVNLLVSIGQRNLRACNVSKNSKRHSCRFSAIVALKVPADAICHRRPPTLTGLVSYTLFHLTPKVDQFTLTGSTLSEQYLYVLQFGFVLKHKVNPDTFPVLKCNFIRLRHWGIKRFHNIPTERVAVM